MGSAPADRSFAEGSSFTCECGTVYAVQRWRWVDARAASERAARVSEFGPFEGSCPGCRSPARARAPWVELADVGAVLHLDHDRRGEVTEILAQHLDVVARASRACKSASWPGELLRPQLSFDAAVDRAQSGNSAASGSAQPSRPAVVETVSEDLVTPIEPSSVDADDGTAGVPQAVGSGILARGRSPRDLGSDDETTASSQAIIGQLMLAEGNVTLHADVDVAARRLWGTAALRARPIHLRDLEYPLLGVRVVASYLGQVSVIDGIIDVGSEQANSVLHALSREFRLELVLHSPDTSTLPREVEAPGLERNAALCMESARAALAAGEFPPDRYNTALDQLASRTVSERMSDPPVSLGVGDYRYLVSARESWLALEHLDEVSSPEHLAQLLEVHGFPVTEFEAIRKRVLVASVEHGICAPRRFWRRIIDSGLADDGKDYVKKLVNGRLACARASQEEDGPRDLPEDQLQEAWQRIYDYCEAKHFKQPGPVLSALGLRVADQAANKGKPAGNPSRMASGVIGGGAAPAGARSPALDALAERLTDPRHRMAAAVEVFEGELDDARRAEVLAKLDGFDPDELLGVSAALIDSHGDPVPGLITKLMSPTRELRQVAAFVLGARGAASALDPLADLLVRERTAAWHDVARAIGSFGEGALSTLRELLDGFTAKDKAKIDRVARAMAEAGVVAGEASLQSMLGEGGLAAVAAERALAMLAVVKRDCERIRGEVPLDNANPAHEFSRRLHESVMTEEVADVEVEMVEETQVIRLEDLEMM